jgi:integrase
MTDEATDTEKPDKPEPRRPGGKTKRGPDKWLLRIFRGYDAGGRRIYYSETFRGGSKDADKRLTELHNRQKAGQPLKFEPKKFSDFFDQWLDDRDDGERRECTIEQYRSTGALYILPAFGKFSLTDITDVAIQRHYKDLRKRKLSQSIVRQVHTILSSLFKLAAKLGLVLQNPLVNVNPPAKPKPKPVAMTGEQTQAFLTAANSRPEAFMFRLAYFLGARPCEYLGLQWKDIDFKQAQVTIRRSLKRRRKQAGWYVTPPKTEKSVRVIALTEALVKDLEAHRRRQLEMKLKAGADWGGHDFIFTDATGELLHERQVRNVHRAICSAAGLPDTFKLKASRHSCASALLAAGVDLKTVSERLGHSSIAITADVYTVVAEQKQREASERLAEAFGIGKK